jgi:arylsulfatase A-like enzyme
MVIDELKAQGMYDDSIILFTSDHGEMLGSHCLWQKMCMYEESARVPLFFKFPSSYTPAIASSDALVSAVDVLPTLCEFLELETPDDMSGLSLMELVRGETWDRERIYIQFDGNGARGNFQRCVVQGNYKLIVDLFKDELFIELYDVGQDPQEQKNLAFESSQEGKIAELLVHLREHMSRTGDLLEIPQDAYPVFLQNYSTFKGSEGK